MSEYLRTPRNGIYSLGNEIPLFCFYGENKFGAVKDVWARGRDGCTPHPDSAPAFGQLRFFGLQEKFGQSQFLRKFACVCMCVRVVFLFLVLKRDILNWSQCGQAS